MLVCRLWRELALATPALWQTIDVAESLRWFTFILPRSASVPLDLLFTTRELVHAALPSLILHSTRIRSLILPGDVPNTSSILSLDMPSLEALDFVTWGPQSTTSLSWREFVLDQQRFPRFRVLRLSHYVFTDAFVGVLHQLQVIDLRVCEFRNQPSSLPAFFDILEACPRLEELRLYRVLSSLHGGSPDHPRLTTKRPLKLHKLVLHDVPSLVALFLSCFTFSSELVTLRLSAWSPTPVRSADVVALLSSLLPTDRSGLPIMRRALTRGSIDSGHSRLKLRCQGPRGDAGWGGTRYPAVTLKIPSWLFAEGRCDGQLANAAEAFVRSFSGLVLEDLSVGTSIYGAMEPAQWTALFSAFPDIRNLDMQGGTPEDLLCALYDLPTEPRTEPDGEEGHDNDEEGHSGNDDNNDGDDDDSDAWTDDEGPPTGTGNEEEDNEEETEHNPLPSTGNGPGTAPRSKTMAGNAPATRLIVPFVLPNLRSLMLYDIDWNPDIIGAASAALCARAMCQMRRLEYLGFLVYTHDAYEMWECMSEWRPILSSMVDKFDFIQAD